MSFSVASGMWQPTTKSLATICMACAIGKSIYHSRDLLPRDQRLSLCAASDNHLRRGKPWRYMMLTGNGQRAPHREKRREEGRERRLLSHIKHKHRREQWRVTTSDEQDMICPPNKRCLRLGLRQSLSSASSSYSDSSSPSHSGSVLCAVNPH